MKEEVLECARRQLVHSFIPGTVLQTGKPQSCELLRERGQSGSCSSEVSENAGTCAEKVPGPGDNWSSGVGPG